MSSTGTGSSSLDAPRLNLRWFSAFSFLLLAVHEFHELTHAVAARLCCGEWPARDFNAWNLAGQCSTSWPTAAGPLFSYFAMLSGAVLAGRSVRGRLAGVALIFAANPFARIFTAAMGGGDEMVVARRLTTIRSPLVLRVIVLAFLLAVCGSAILFGWRQMALAGGQRRVRWPLIVLIWPMVLTGVALFAVGNRALRAGLLATPTVGGAPLLVALVSGAAILLSLLTAPWLVGEQSKQSGVPGAVPGARVPLFFRT